MKEIVSNSAKKHRYILTPSILFELYTVPVKSNQKYPAKRENGSQIIEPITRYERIKRNCQEKMGTRTAPAIAIVNSAMRLFVTAALVLLTPVCELEAAPVDAEPDDDDEIAI